eukprot:s1988_g10.t1
MSSITNVARASKSSKIKGNSLVQLFCRDTLLCKFCQFSPLLDCGSGNALRAGFVPAAVKAVQEPVRNTYRPTVTKHR